MKINIKDQEFELHYTMRMMIIYENITGETMDFDNLASMKQVTTLFLACILASAHKAKANLQLTYDEYIDWLDQNGGYDIVGKFTLWLLDEIKAQYSLKAEELEEEDDEEKKV